MSGVGVSLFRTKRTKGTKSTKGTKELLENGDTLEKRFVLIIFLFCYILIKKIFVAFVFLCELRAKKETPTPA
jgi:hypothetical protein